MMSQYVHTAPHSARGADLRRRVAGARRGVAPARPGSRFRCWRSCPARCAPAPRARPCRPSDRVPRRPAAGCAPPARAFCARCWRRPPPACASSRACRCRTATAGTAASRSRRPESYCEPLHDHKPTTLRETRRARRSAPCPGPASMRSSWLYLAMRSERDSEPVLIWVAARADREVRDGGVLGLARAMRHHRGIAGLLGHARSRPGSRSACRSGSA